MNRYPIVSDIPILILIYIYTLERTCPENLGLFIIQCTIYNLHRLPMQSKEAVYINSQQPQSSLERVQIIIKLEHLLLLLLI